MHAIGFEADIENGTIKLPSQYRDMDDDAVLQEGYGAELMRAHWGSE